MAADAASIRLDCRGLLFSAAANSQRTGFDLFQILIAEVRNCLGTASADFLRLRIATLKNLIKKLFSFFSRGVGSPGRTIFANRIETLAALLIAKHQNE